MKWFGLFSIASVLLFSTSAMAQLGPTVNVMPAGPGTFIIGGTHLHPGCIIRFMLPVNSNGALREFANTTVDRWGDVFEWNAHYPCSSAQGLLRVVVKGCIPSILWDQKTTSNVCLPANR